MLTHKALHYIDLADAAAEKAEKAAAEMLETTRRPAP